MLKDIEANLCCIPSQQQIKLTLWFVLFYLSLQKVVSFLFKRNDNREAWTFTFLFFVFLYVNTELSDEVAQLNKSVFPPKFIQNS